MNKAGVFFAIPFLVMVACAPAHQEPTTTAAAPVETAVPVPQASNTNFTALPDTAFKVQWLEHSLVGSVPASGVVRGYLTLRNAGDKTWPDIEATKTEPRGSGAVRIGFRWLKSEGLGPNEGYAPERIELPQSLNPGETARVEVSVPAPSEPGTYDLEFDVVQELVSWFGAKGADTLKVHVKVTP